jgi:cell division transport system permease protein
MSRRAAAPAAPRTQPRRREPAASVARPDISIAQLKGHAPLVPVHSAASRALVGVIAILTFLASLCAGGAALVAASSEQWRSAIGREATIQVRPSPQRDMEADLMLAAELARRTVGVRGVEVPTKAEAERTLEPWLGRGLDLGDLPVPRLVVLRLAEGMPADLTDLRRRLASSVPGAVLDDHGAWLARLSGMANAIVAIGIGLAALVLVAAGLAVGFATQGAMAGNREVVAVLHVVGADDAFIAREFQRRFFRMALKGSLAGSALALVVIAALSLASAAWEASPAGDQIEALFGRFDVGWRGYAAIGFIALAVPVLTAAVSRLTVKHFLTRSP